jgi:hypothetical protein
VYSTIRSINCLLFMAAFLLADVDLFESYPW